MPEVDFSRFTKLSRGRYAERARRSLKVLESAVSSMLMKRGTFVGLVGLALCAGGPSCGGEVLAGHGGSPTSSRADGAVDATAAPDAGALPVDAPACPSQPPLDPLLDGATEASALSCDAVENQAQSVLEAAIAQAQADLGCQTDSDCVYFRDGPDCIFTCGGTVLTRCGAAAVEATMAQVNAQLCANQPQGCTPFVHSCGQLPGGPQAACVAGTCIDFPPATWLAFTFEEVQGGTPGTFGLPQTCTAPGCTTWAVTSDARVVISKGGQIGSAKLSAADFATVDAILRDPAFRAIGAGTNVSCDTPPNGQEISLSVERAAELIGFDVTGCVLVGPSGNQVKQLFDVVHAY